MLRAPRDLWEGSLRRTLAVAPSDPSRLFVTMHLRAATTEIQRALRATWTPPPSAVEADVAADALVRLCALGAHRRIEACAMAWADRHPVAAAAALCRGQAGVSTPLGLLQGWQTTPAAQWTPDHLAATLLVWTVGQAISLPIQPARLPRWGLNAETRDPVLSVCTQLLATHAPGIGATLPTGSSSGALPHAKDEQQGRLLRLLRLARATAARNDMPAPAALLALAGSVAHGAALPFAVWRIDQAMARDEAMTATAWLRSLRQHAGSDDARAWADLLQGVAMVEHPARADEESYRNALRRQDYASAAVAGARAALRISDPALSFSRALTAAWLGELARLAVDVRDGLWRAVHRAAQRTDDGLWQLYVAADLSSQNWEDVREPTDVFSLCQSLVARPDGAAWGAAVHWLEAVARPDPPQDARGPFDGSQHAALVASRFPAGSEATWWLHASQLAGPADHAAWCRTGPGGLPVVETTASADAVLLRDPEPLWAVARAHALGSRLGLPDEVDAEIDRRLDDSDWDAAILGLQAFADQQGEGSPAAWTLLTVAACYAQGEAHAAASGDAVVDAVTTSPADRAVRQVAVALLTALGQTERVRALETLVPLPALAHTAPTVMVSQDIHEPVRAPLVDATPTRDSASQTDPRAAALDPLRTLLGAARARDTMAFLRLLDRGERLAVAEVPQEDRRVVAWAALEAARVVQRRPAGQVQALPLAEAARTLDPRCGAAHAFVAAHYEASGAWDEAAAALQSAARNEPDPQQRARWYLQLGQWFEGPLQHRQAALEHYLIAFMCEATLPGVLEHLEQLCRGLGRWKDLAGSLEIAVAHARQFPDQPWTLTPLLLRLAEVQLKRLEQPTRAAETLLEAARMAPAEAKALRLLLQHAAGAAEEDAVRRAVQAHRETLDLDARARFDAQPYVAGWV